MEHPVVDDDDDDGTLSPSILNYLNRGRWLDVSKATIIGEKINRNTTSK